MLRTHKKLTKKELKQDPLLIFIAQFYEYLRKEWLKIVATIVVVAAVVTLSVLFVKWRMNASVASYNKALNSLQSNAPESMDLLAKVVQDYGSSKSAADALMLLGNISFGKKDYNTAERYFRQYIDKFSSDPIYTFNSYNILGSIYEEKGDFKKAGQIYEEFISKCKDSVFIPTMYLNAGKAYFTAGDKEAAKRNLAKLTETDDDTQTKQEALFYLEMIN